MAPTFNNNNNSNNSLINYNNKAFKNTETTTTAKLFHRARTTEIATTINNCISIKNSSSHNNNYCNNSNNSNNSSNYNINYNIEFQATTRNWVVKQKSIKILDIFEKKMNLIRSKFLDLSLR